MSRYQHRLASQPRETAVTDNRLHLVRQRKHLSQQRIGRLAYVTFQDDVSVSPRALCVGKDFPHRGVDCRLRRMQEMGHSLQRFS